MRLGTKIDTIESSELKDPITFYFAARWQLLICNQHRAESTNVAIIQIRSAREEERERIQKSKRQTALINRFVCRLMWSVLRSQLTKLIINWNNQVMCFAGSGSSAYSIHSTLRSRMSVASSTTSTRTLTQLIARAHTLFVVFVRQPTQLTRIVRNWSNEMQDIQHVLLAPYQFAEHVW